jgi:hypothetical protein
VIVLMLVVEYKLSIGLQRTTKYQLVYLIVVKFMIKVVFPMSNLSILASVRSA